MQGGILSVPAIPIVVDTREQNPWPLDGFVSIIKGLPTGDYSILGYEDKVAVERKSKADAWGCVGKGRARFERCMERLGALESALVVIESDLADFTVRPPHVKRVTPATAVGSYVSWMCRYRVPVVWAGDRMFAERLAIRFLGAYLKYRVKGDGV